MSAGPQPPRRAQTYDHYSSGLADVQEHADGNGAALDRSHTMRDYARPLDLPELSMTPSPQPPPSYSVAVGEQYDGFTPSDSSTAPSVHRDSPSAADDSPYGGIDYLGRLPYDQPNNASDSRFSTASGNSGSNDLSGDFSSLRLTSPSPTPSQHSGVMSAGAYPGYNQQSAAGLPPRGRSLTGRGYATQHGNDSAAASVYSLDTGMNAYAQQRRPYPGIGQGAPPPVRPGGPGGWPPNAQQQGSFLQRQPTGDFNSPYYNAANDFVGMPPQHTGGMPPQHTGGMPPQHTGGMPPQHTGGMPPQHTGGGPGAYPGGGRGPPSVHGPSRQTSMTNLVRTNTSRSTLSLSSINSVPPPRVTESVGASSTRRRGGAVAIDVSKPPYTREFVDDYRNRMKVDPDPEAQFAFAKYLIEAAKKIGDEIAATDPRHGRKYRDSLLAESLRNIKKLAEGKEPYADAQFFLANLYGTGQLGLQVDHEKAYYLYLMASKLNHPAATYRAAVCCELGAGTKRDPNRSVLFYRKAAALGDTAAMYKLGVILLNGMMGHPRNPREALVWLRRAATQADEDNPHALHELALLHERPNNGTQGVIPQDPHLAREYLTQAAQLGYAPSQFKLGSCHEFGTLGFPIDPRRSIAWYTRAAERGDAEAELALSGWYLTGSEGVLKQSDTEAYLWGRKAANKGLAKAEYAVGYYTEIGIGVKQDMELAKRWYMRSASQGNKRAMQRLAELNSNRNVKGGGRRPTRKDAENECVIM